MPKLEFSTRNSDIRSRQKCTSPGTPDLVPHDFSKDPARHRRSRGEQTIFTGRQFTVFQNSGFFRNSDFRVLKLKSWSLATSTLQKLSVSCASGERRDQFNGSGISQPDFVFQQFAQRNVGCGQGFPRR